MTQNSGSETPIQASNEKAVIWARQMMTRKRAEQKKMEEDYKSDPQAQALVAELFRKNKQQKG